MAYEDTFIDPMLYGEDPELVGTPMPYPMPAPIGPSPVINPQAPPQGFGARLKAALPGMLNAAIDAGATPNIAGGGAVDVLRAMQAARQGAMQRDLLGYNLQRQQAADMRDAEMRAAQRAQYEAAAARYNAMANAKPVAKAPTVEEQLYAAYNSETDPALKAAAWNRYLQFKHGNVAQPAAPRPITVGAGQTVFDPATGKPLYTAPGAEKPVTPPAPISVSPGSTLVDRTTGKPIYTAPDRPERGSRPPQATPAQFRAVESEKQRNLMAAEREARKRINDGEDQGSVFADLEAQKQQIQDGYEAQIDALGGNAQHMEYGSQPKPPQANAGGKKKLTDMNIAQQYLQRAGNDKQKARQLAAAEGWSF